MTLEDRPDATEAAGGIGPVRLGAIVVLAAAAAVVTWLLVKGDDEKSPATTVTAASPDDLRKLPASVGHPVYWAGPMRGVTYELTRAKKGDVYIRYLPAGVALEDKRPDFLTVGTYPYAQALSYARSQADEAGVFKRTIAGHGIAFSSKKKPESVFFAYPRLDYLFEVYDPTPLRARRLVLSGRVRPVG